MLLVVIYAVNIITLIWSENMGGKTIEFERVEAEAEINKQAQKKTEEEKDTLKNNG